MNRPRYDTVMERCSPNTEKVLLPFILEHMLGKANLLLEGEVDSIRLAQVNEVIETVVTGRKYEILLLRSQGKSMAEIAMLLSISKSTVQNHYRRAIQQVRQALGFDLKNSTSARPSSPKEVEPVSV
ncbi:MAG: LuxR C-terminal-related transcriptional regulator [bacterium]|nr:LuxR C-terminal-related transcriptional regulator [bacterium]